MRRKIKYGNKKVRAEFNGEEVIFDSRLERNRYEFLLEAQQAGQITNLRRQVPYEVIPKQMGYKVKKLKTKEKIVAYTAEQPTIYIADFVYNINFVDHVITEVIEDTKSEATRKDSAYIIKRKLMRLQGRPIKEILKANEPILW